jgi:cell wall-associated NlpC family hydrolase
MSRLLPIAASLAVIAAPTAGATTIPAPGAPSAPRSATTRTTSSAAAAWALPEIRVVVSHGLMAPDVASFRPTAPLTQRALAALVAGLTESPAVKPANPAAGVTIAQLDAQLVRALGLADDASMFVQEATSAGLVPPARFGTEVVARLLGLRTNHPASQDDLELLPSDIATRAEAAYSAAQILRFAGWETQAVDDAAANFALPQLTPWQRRILQTAVRFIGYPYVWGGTSEFAEAPFGVHARGGFDCSGFVWRVYKLQPYANEGPLASVLRGRTTFQMSGEVPRSRRVPFAKLAPADVLFFGAGGPRSQPAQVNHTGIYLGNGWMIHSSEQGVYLSQLEGWYRRRFAWARRPLGEAGLT